MNLIVRTLGTPTVDDLTFITNDKVPTYSSLPFTSHTPTNI